jgi:hypothetical protein
MVLHRPVELAGVIGMWPGTPACGEKAHSDKTYRDVGLPSLAATLSTAEVYECTARPYFSIGQKGT